MLQYKVFPGSRNLAPDYCVVDIRVCNVSLGAHGCKPNMSNLISNTKTKMLELVKLVNHMTIFDAFIGLFHFQKAKVG